MRREMGHVLTVLAELALLQLHWLHVRSCTARGKVSDATASQTAFCTDLQYLGYTLIYITLYMCYLHVTTIPSRYLALTGQVETMTLLLLCCECM